MNSPLNRPFRMIVFDWDGTAVESRKEDATPMRQRLERLMKLGVNIVVITGTNFGNIDRQLSAAIQGPHKQRLYICTNRGSEVFGFDARSKPVLLFRRSATAKENEFLTRAADRTKEAIVAETKLKIEVVYNRFNRRKIDLIPLPEWRDPPKAVIGELLEAVEHRLKSAGLEGGLHEAIALAFKMASEVGLKDPRITSDVKHVEIGLTDKGDSVAWAMSNIATKQGIAPKHVLIGGDEFGPVAGFPGSDYKMVVDAAKGATFVTVGVEPEGVPPKIIDLGGGPQRFGELLDEQIELHEKATEGIPLPPIKPSFFTPTADPNWLLVQVRLEPTREHEIESIYTIANGSSGTRGAIDEGSPYSHPDTFLAGVYDEADRPFHLPELVVEPDWTKLSIWVGDEELVVTRGTIIEHRRILDMRRGMMLREWSQRDNAGRVTAIRFLRFASLADRDLLVQAVALTPQNYTERVRIEYIVDGDVANFGDVHHLKPVSASESSLVMRTRSSGRTIALAMATRLHSEHPLQATHESDGEGARIKESWEWEAYLGTSYQLDRLVTVATSRKFQRPRETTTTHLHLLIKETLEDLLSAHEHAWTDRWSAADIEVSGDSEVQLFLRFALYHLISVANPGDDWISVGARGLSGEAYKGHVFWDTEIYMLPFWVFTDPASARACLMYRYHCLAAAKARALEMGYRGALYPWESAGTGEDATPPFVLTPTGEVIPIRSRLEEHHISADIPYAVWQYWKATGDDDFLLEAGAEIVLETARFWVSRVTMEEDGRYHIKDAIGPDEYHEGVNDNAYTNVLAQWVLERAAEVTEILGQRWPDRWEELSRQLSLKNDEIEGWREIAGKMYTGYDPETGLIEQFAGYFDLEDIDLAAYEPRTAPMDVVLGHERIQSTQIIKQADVVLLIHLLWDRFPEKAHTANFRYYEPRTGQGSSLSPCIYALVAARLGDLALAKKFFTQGAEIDLANNMGNAAEGVHLGAMGGLWQALVFGFAGMNMREDGLSFDPHLPSEWGTVRFPVKWRGRSLRVSISGAPATIEVALESGAPMVISVDGNIGKTIEVGKRFRTRLSGRVWSSWEEASP